MFGGQAFQTLYRALRQGVVGRPRAGEPRFATVLGYTALGYDAPVQASDRGHEMGMQPAG